MERGSGSAGDAGEAKSEGFAVPQDFGGGELAIVDTKSRDRAIETVAPSGTEPCAQRCRGDREIIRDAVVAGGRLVQGPVEVNPSVGRVERDDDMSPLFER